MFYLDGAQLQKSSGKGFDMLMEREMWSCKKIVLKTVAVRTEGEGVEAS